MKLFHLFESKELTSELIKLQRYITDHDLETQLEIKNDKIVFRVGKKFIKWDAEEARRIRTDVLTQSNHSYYYARDVIKERWRLGELVIAKDAAYSYWYAKNVVKGPWKLGESSILKSPVYSFIYARDVIKERWEIGEPTISTSSYYSEQYQEFLKTLK